MSKYIPVSRNTRHETLLEIANKIAKDSGKTHNFSPSTGAGGKSKAGNSRQDIYKWIVESGQKKKNTLWDPQRGKFVTKAEAKEDSATTVAGGEGTVAAATVDEREGELKPFFDASATQIQKIVRGNRGRKQAMLEQAAEAELAPRRNAKKLLYDIADKAVDKSEAAKERKAQKQLEEAKREIKKQEEAKRKQEKEIKRQEKENKKETPEEESNRKQQKKMIMQEIKARSKKFNEDLAADAEARKQRDIINNAARKIQKEKDDAEAPQPEPVFKKINRKNVGEIEEGEAKVPTKTLNKNMNPTAPKSAIQRALQKQKDRLKLKHRGVKFNKLGAPIRERVKNIL